MQIETVAVERLIPYARNSRTHSEAQVAQIAASIREFGFTNPVLIDADGGIIAGHGRVMGARQLQMTEVPCIRLGHLTDAQRRAYVIADNKLAANAGWDEEMLGLELRELMAGGYDVGLTGFTLPEIDELLADLDKTPKPAKVPDYLPQQQEVAITKPGDVWILGRHRLMCGDSTSDEQIQMLLGGGSVDLICTDPPYCSGGFQETGKSAGSVGTSATHKMVANDTLSARGYMALLRAAFQKLGAPYLYAFTDWRMWLSLFDVAESSGFGVRSMIVWDKGTPGMWRGWRAQHELVLWACKKTAPFDKHASGQGNVLQAKRTGNVHHTTQKPVEIIEALLANTPFATRVADPFNGSGTTMIACESQSRIYFGMELDPLYVDTSVRRWQQFTGKRATLEATGSEFPG